MYVNLILKYCKSVDVFIGRKIFAPPKHTTCKDNSNTRILSYVNVHYWGPKNCKKRKRFMILTRSRRDERDLVEINEISKNSARFVMSLRSRREKRFFAEISPITRRDWKVEKLSPTHTMHPKRPRYTRKTAKNCHMESWKDCIILLFVLTII